MPAVHLLPVPAPLALWCAPTVAYSASRALRCARRHTSGNAPRLGAHIGAVRAM